MAEVRAVKAAIAVEYPVTPMGTLLAYTRIDATGFNGMRVNKRIRIGMEHGVTVENATVMMRNLRAANNGDYGNPKADISGRLIIEV